jgi:hypothetical protein
MRLQLVFTIGLALIILALPQPLYAQYNNPPAPCIPAIEAPRAQAQPLTEQAEILAQQFVCLLRQEYGYGFNPVFYHLASPHYRECQQELLAKGKQLTLPINVQLALDKWSDELLRKHHEVTLNFLHFTTLAVLHFQQQTNNAQAQLSDLPQIKSLARSEPGLRQLLQINTNNEARPIVIKSEAQLSILHTRLSNIMIAVQNYLATAAATTKPPYLKPQISQIEITDDCASVNGEVVQIKVPLESFLPARKTPISSSYILICKPVHGELKIVKIEIAN